MPESSAARLERLLQLIPWLAANPFVTISQAAAHFGVSAAQIHADLRDVCDIDVRGPLGFEHIAIRYWHSDDTVDPDAPIIVDDALGLDRPFRMGADQAALLLYALETLSLLLPGDRPDLDSTMAKIRAAYRELPQGDRGSVLRRRAANDGLAQTLQSACERGARVRITYLSAADDMPKSRVIQPVEMVENAGQTEYHAWCEEAKGWRTFLLERMQTAEIVDDSGETSRPVHTSAPSGNGFIGGQLITVALTPAGQYLLEDLPNVKIVDAAASADTVTATFNATTEWTVRWALQNADLVRVQSPEEIRSRVTELAHEALAQED